MVVRKKSFHFEKVKNKDLYTFSLDDSQRGGNQFSRF